MANFGWGSDERMSSRQAVQAAQVTPVDSAIQKKEQNMRRLKRIAEERRKAEDARNARLKEAEIYGLMTPPDESSQEFIRSRDVQNKMPFKLHPYTQGFNMQHKGLLPSDKEYMNQRMLGGI